jgi:threonine dehydrogenase-like Zn-dependent dehydrogenase
VSVWEPGDRVLVPFQVSCGRCPACASGRFAACHRYRARAGASFGFGSSGGGHGGAISDLLVVPAADHMLVAAPAGVPDAVACTLPDNVVDAYRCLSPGPVTTQGAEVLVVGGAAASIGLYVVALARGLGAARVRYVDTDAERCAAAERLGAEVTRHEGSWPARFDRAPVTIDNTGDAEGLSCTIRSTDDFGTCTSVAPQFAPATPVPLLAMYTKGITFHVSRADSRRFLPEVAELVASGIADPAGVPTAVVPWIKPTALGLIPRSSW